LGLDLGQSYRSVKAKTPARNPSIDVDGVRGTRTGSLLGAIHDG
jgi:hypothetical protein